jgi:hypothetical protein|tara:strand:+ start:536 stop:949 length:414 start_codon:yes stop_codon:yes gene_type:complete
MKNKKIFTFITLIIFFQFFYINLKAEDLNKIDDEELPALDPFQGGAVATSEEQSDQTNSFLSDITNIRLVGTAIAGGGNFALISLPNGTTVVKGEDEMIIADIQLLDIDHDWIGVRVNAEKNYDININGQIVSQEGN